MHQLIAVKIGSAKADFPVENQCLKAVGKHVCEGLP